MNRTIASALIVNAILLARLLCAASDANAQPSKRADADERTAWTVELKRAKDEAPEEYAEAQRNFTFMAELLLARLGYDVAPIDGVLDDSTRAAIKRYEKTRSLPETGDPLTFATMKKISEDAANLDAQPVGLAFLHLFLDLWDQGYVGAEGTWTIVGEDMGWPEQTSNISCDRSAGTCAEATAIVSRGIGGPLLSVDIDTYEIERWDEHEIVTKPLQFGCTRYVRRISRTQKSVTGIRSTTSAKEQCKNIDNSEKFLVLADGFEVSQRLTKKWQQNWSTLTQLSPELRKWLDRTSAE